MPGAVKQRGFDGLGGCLPVIGASTRVLMAPLGPPSSLPTASIPPSGSLDQVQSCEPGAAIGAEEFEPGREGVLRGNF